MGRRWGHTRAASIMLAWILKQTYAAQSAIRTRRWSNRSVRRYAASTRSVLTCTRASSQPRAGHRALGGPVLEADRKPCGTGRSRPRGLRAPRPSGRRSARGTRTRGGCPVRIETVHAPPCDRDLGVRQGALVLLHRRVLRSAAETASSAGLSMRRPCATAPLHDGADALAHALGGDALDGPDGRRTATPLGCAEVVSKTPRGRWPTGWRKVSGIGELARRASFGSSPRPISRLSRRHLVSGR